jgi:hypothetical protein
MARIQDGTNLYTPNILIVDPNWNTPFTTITLALTAAVDMALVNPTIYIRAGTYTENLTLVDGISFRGDNAETCIIDGTHTLPAINCTSTFSNLKLRASTPGTSIFIESVAGSDYNLTIKDCIFDINSGTIFNIPLALTAFLHIDNCSDVSGVGSNTIINTVPGPIGWLTISQSVIGAGNFPAIVGLPALVLENSSIQVPVELSGITSLTGSRSSIRKCSLADMTSLYLYNSTIDSGVNEALDIGATAEAFLHNVVITSFAPNAIVGLGSCTFGEVTYTDTSTNTVTTKVYTTKVETGELQLDDANTGNVYLNAGLLTPQALTDGQLQIGSTGAAPTAAAITAGAGISVTNGAGSITIAATTLDTWTPIAADGALTTNTSYLNTKAGLLTVSLPAASAQGDMLRIQGYGAGGFLLTQGAGQQILIAGTNTTLGAAGTLASSDKGDGVSLVCTTANLEWRAFGVVGNLTVV